MDWTRGTSTVGNECLLLDSCCVSLCTDRTTRARLHGRMTIQLTRCPELGCSMPAEMVDRFMLASTDGPIEHVRTYCLAGHMITIPTERLATDPSPCPEPRLGRFAPRAGRSDP